MRSILRFACLLLLAAATGALAQHHFRDAARWAKEFDDPARDAWQKPDQVIRALAPAPAPYTTTCK